MKNHLCSLCFSLLLPLAVGALPIEVDPATPLTGTYAVEWDTPGDFESWATTEVTGAAVSGGALSGTTGGTDPQLTRSNLSSGPDLDLGFNDFIELRMQVPASFADDIQIYYGTTGATGFSGDRIITIPNATLATDGSFHTYRIDAGQEPWWRATLRDLRIDPGNASGVTFAIDYLRVGDEPNPTVYQPRFTTKCPAAGGATPAEAYYGPGQLVSSMESKHFRFLWNNNVTTHTSWTTTMAKGTLRNLEEVWQVYVKILGYREPCFNIGTTSGTAYKLNVTSYYSGYWSGVDEYDGTSLAQLNITPDGLQVDPPTWVIPHELMHCFQFHNTSGHVNGEWYETHANYGRERWLNHYQNVYPNRSNIEALGVRDGHLMMSSGRNYYLTWPFMYYVDTNPDALSDLYDGIVAKVWQETQSGEFPMMTLDRLTATTSLKDIVGYYARRCATWDFSNQAAMTAELNTQDPTRNARHMFTDLVQCADDPSWWRVPLEKAPAQGAYAIHQLVPEGTGAGRVVTVNLQGLADSTRGADWRASFIAVSDTGVERYTPLWDAGSSSITLAADENTLYLSVAGAPDVFHYGGHDESNYRFRSHPSRSRFHYEVQVTGATPRERDNGSTAGLVVHSNGGGYKASTASVAATAYLGPNARVLDNATVSNTARIEDYAVVADNAIVRNNAVVSGHAWVRGTAVIEDDARVRDWAIVDSGTLSGNARALEHATVGGNMQDTAVAKGSAIHQSGGTLSGNAIVDGDYMFNKSLTNGVTFGHQPFVGVPDDFTTATPTGLFAAYNFDTGHDSRALDQYGITDGFTIGSPDWIFTDDERKGFLTFNGSSQSVALDRSVADSRAFTFAAWVKPAGGPANQAVLWLGATTTRRLALTPDDGSGHAKFSIVNEGAEQTLSSTAALPVGVWSHVAVTLDGATGVLYIDGSVAASGSITIRPDELLAANTTTGAQHNYLARSEGSSMPMFQGALDDAQFFSSALSAAQLSAATVPPLSGVGTLLLSDSFNSESYSATDFNSTLAADQQGLLAPTLYTVVTGGQGWQAQHGNGATMLLVGDAGYGSRASVNEDFSIAANGLNLPLSFQFDASIADGSSDCWSSITIGSGQNLFAYSVGAKFGIQPKANGDLEVWVNGLLQPLASHSGNSYRIVLSDTVGSGSAFNGNGSKATLYNGATLVGAYTLSQLASGDGYLSFGAQPDNGYTITRIDNLSISWIPNIGLAALYYNNAAIDQANIASLPALRAHFGANSPAPTLVNTATSMNFAGDGSGFPAPYNSGALNFEAFYSGRVNITTAGTYTFNTSSDDGSMLFIDGQVVVVNNAFQGITTQTGSIALTAGMHDIVIAYNQGGGGYGMNAQMSGADNTTMVDLNTANVDITPDLVVGSLAGEGTVSLSTGNLITGIDNSSTSFSGVISGIGSVTKFGAGAQVFAGTNTYSGGTIVEAGTLGVDTTGTLGSSNLTVAAGAICELRNVSGAIADAAAVTLNGSGKLAIASGVAETVARLYVDSVLQLAGTYTAVSHPALISGDGSLVVTDGIPVAPSGLSATAVSATAIDLAWTDHASDETGYLVERSTSSGSGFGQIASLAAGSVSYGDTGLAAGATYYYRVRAANSHGNSAYCGEASATTLVATGDGVWTSLTDGNWSLSGNWQGFVIAAGADKTATFAQATGATVTVDGGRTIGNLAFDVSDYRLAGSALTLASASGTSTVSVATDRTALVSAVLTGGVGLLKTGSGTLALSGANSYSGTTAISGGTLRLQGSGAPLLTDSFTAVGTPDTGDLNYNLANRQTGSEATQSWTKTGNAQVGNATDVGQPGGTSNADYLLLAFGAQAKLADLSLSSANVTGPVKINFDMFKGSTADPNQWTSFTMTPTGDYWPVVGSGQVGFLYRQNSGIQIFNNNDAMQSFDSTSGGDSFAFYLADTDGTGSPFGGNGTRLIVTQGGSVLGSYALNTGMGTSYLAFGTPGSSDMIGGVDNLAVNPQQTNILNPSTHVTLTTAGTTQELDNVVQTIAGLDGVAGTSMAMGPFSRLTVNGSTDSTFSGVISGTLAGLAKSGSGKLTLAGANTYSGGTLVEAGTLRIDGDSSGATGALTVESGAFLGGNGSYGGNITLNAGAALNCELNAVDSTLTCGGQLSFTDLDFADCMFTPAPGTSLRRTFTLIEAASLGTATIANAQGMVADVSAELYISGRNLMLRVASRGTVISLR